MIRILALITLLTIFCLTSVVKAEARTFRRVLKDNPVQVNQLLQTKQCPSCKLNTADLSNTDLRGANLFKAELIKANLARTNLGSANLAEVNLEFAELKGANLVNANLNQADMVAAKLAGADLRRADLEKASLVNADLTGANLSGANLFRANLTGADLKGADLSHANLTRTDLRTAELAQANLSQANLSHAYLKETQLNETNLSGAILPRSHVVRTPLLPLGSLVVLVLLWCWQCRQTLGMCSLFWQGILLVGSALSGWILSIFTAPHFGWIMVLSGATLGTLAGLLEGWHTKRLKQKKVKVVDRKGGAVVDRKGGAIVDRKREFDRAAVLGLCPGLVAGLIAGIITWVFVLPGVFYFAQWGLDASYYWSWSKGLGLHQPGPVGLSSEFPSLLSFISLSVLRTVIHPGVWLMTRTEDPCAGGADSIGSGTYYFANLGTVAPVLITVAIALAVTTTVSKTKIHAFGLGTFEVRTLKVVAIVTCIGLVVGWIIDILVLPGYGANLSLFTRECK